MTPSTPPIRPITHGPEYHWFGYYDKWQVDPTGRYALGMAVDFEHRPPEATDVIKIGMVDLVDGDRWTELDQSRAWCWQAGCMLQWRPGSGGDFVSGREIVWNDREGDRFVAHMLDVETKAKRTLPQPIFTLSPDGRTALGLDFHRLDDMRPGYGYAGIPDPNRDVLAPDDAGIYRLDLETGASDLILSLAEIARLDKVQLCHSGDLREAKHYFNVLIFNPAGTRFLFLHRWRFGDGGFHTRMLTARPDGTEVRVVDASGQTSHLIWRDNEHILAWSWHASQGQQFYLFSDSGETSCPADDVEPVGTGVMTLNGHCTYLTKYNFVTPSGQSATLDSPQSTTLDSSNTDWILNDTYPDGEARLQRLYLYHVPSKQKFSLGDFHAPPAYTGPQRCDLHPRFSPDGRSVIIDSAHGGDGRQMYLVDISGIVT